LGHVGIDQEAVQEAIGHCLSKNPAQIAGMANTKATSASVGYADAVVSF
jgi:hypothetical protein